MMVGLQGAAPRHRWPRRSACRAADEESAAATLGGRRSSRRSSTSSTSRCRAGCRSAPRARCSTSRTPPSCRSSAIRRTGQRTIQEAVFYFPGCGSERLFSQVGLATQAMLYHVGAQTVLPPGYLCCGYPQTAGGDAEKGSRSARQPRAVPPRRQHAELPRHQDRDRVVRHLHGPAAEVRIRQDLPGLPAARHPRIPDGKGREARRRPRRALHVSRPLPHADEDACADEGRQPADRRPTAARSR
jgi:hypothetical protein